MNIPHDQRAENGILGHLITDGMNAFEQCRRLRPEMFYLDSHRKLFVALSELLESGISPDYTALAAVLRTKGWLDSVGGMDGICELDFGLVRGANIEHHAKRIAEMWKQRRGLEISDRYRGLFQQEADADELLGAMQTDVFDAMQERTSTMEPLVFHYTIPTLNAFMKPADEEVGLGFGIARLDELTGGMRPKEVTVVGARSGVGKSSLMCQVAAEHCSKGTAVDLFSLEMSKETLLHRIWSIVSGVPFFKIHRPKEANVSEKKLVHDAACQVAEWPLRIHDDAEITLGEIATLARMSARRHSMKLFVVDYAQIVNAEGKDERLRVANVSRTLTKLAKSEGVHLMLLSQLRKVPAEQYARPPHIADLRETGQLENDAHLVVLLHRGWDEASGSISYDAEILLPKQRNGVTGTIPAQFNPRTLTFA